MHKLYTELPWLWKIVNNVPLLHNAAMRYIYLSEYETKENQVQISKSVVFLSTGRGDMVESPPRYNTGYDYITTETHFNTSYYARSLPPVPRNCPTPMGTAGEIRFLYYIYY